MTRCAVTADETLTVYRETVADANRRVYGYYTVPATCGVCDWLWAVGFTTGLCEMKRAKVVKKDRIACEYFVEK